MKSIKKYLTKDNCTSVTCEKCKTEKSVKEFYANKDGTLKLDMCKECRTQYNKEWYKNNKEQHKKTAGKSRDKYRLEIRSLILNYFVTHPCIDCGERNPLVLDFDHVRGQKKFALSQAARLGYNKDRVLKEIEKCEVRCANCHRLKTAKDQEWYKDFHTLLLQENKASVSKYFGHLNEIN